MRQIRSSMFVAALGLVFLSLIYLKPATSLGAGPGQFRGPRSVILRQTDGKLILYRWDGQRLERSVNTGVSRMPRIMPKTCMK